MLVYLEKTHIKILEPLWNWSRKQADGSAVWQYPPFDLL